MVEALDKIADEAANANDEPLMIDTGRDGKPKVPDALKDESSDSEEEAKEANEYEPTEMNSFGFFSDSNDAVS